MQINNYVNHKKNTTVQHKTQYVYTYIHNYIFLNLLTITTKNSLHTGVHIAAFLLRFKRSGVCEAKPAYVPANAATLVDFVFPFFLERVPAVPSTGVMHRFYF